MADAAPQHTYYSVADEAVLPDAARFPWDLVGAGGTLSSGMVQITGTSARAGYERSYDVEAQTDRFEAQVDFQGVTNNASWSGGLVSGHVLWLDDGHRMFGLAIGSTLALINPFTGTQIAELAQDQQPGGFTQKRSYHLIKDGTESWEVWVDGQLVVRVPYIAAPVAIHTVATSGFGWQDTTGNGTAKWDRVETGLNVVLAPHTKVDRQRDAMDPELLAHWSPRHEATLRALVGVHHAQADAMARVAGRFTGGVIDVEQGEFVGDVDPADEGWIVDGTPTIDRERVHLDADTTPGGFTFEFTTLANPAEALIEGSARIVVRSVTTTDAVGRAGPAVIVRNAHREIGVFLFQELGNPEAFYYQLSDGNLSGGAGTTGDVRLYLDPFTEHEVELYVVARERVIWFVDGELVEDVPYDRFSNTTTDTEVQIARDGSADIACAADYSDGLARVAYGDGSYRPHFQRRVAERLIFAAGCERNDQLDTWMRHRPGVFRTRGTDRCITEVRRVACDDDAALVVTRTPADWYVEYTYPELTPVFIEANTELLDVAVEFRADAPNFQPDELEKLIEFYLLPTSIIEHQWDAMLTTDLTSSTSNATDTSFDVAVVTGFSVGDPVALREEDTGTVVALTYDASQGVTALASGTVRDFSGNGDDGTITGPDASLGHTPEGDAVLLADSLVATDGIRSPSFVVDMSAGITVGGWYRNKGILLLTAQLTESQNGIGTGGFHVTFAAGNLTAAVFSGASSKAIPVHAFAPAAGTWTHVIMRFDPANGISLWLDGVKVKETTGAFAASNPPANPVGFGVEFSGALVKWPGDLRDVLLYERPLTDTEIEDLFEDTDGRDALRSDSALRLWYLPSGHNVVAATMDSGIQLAADQMLVTSRQGLVHADFMFRADGASIDGVINQIAGQDNQKLANHTAGQACRVVSTSAAEDTWVEVYGRANGSGNPVVERVHVVGTTPVLTTALFAASGVFGIAIMPGQPDGVGTITAVDPAGPTTLYSMVAGVRSRGVKLFEPPLVLEGDFPVVVSSGASTASTVLAGTRVGGVDTPLTLSLNGTTPVTGASRYALVRGWAIGYVPVAQQVSLRGGVATPTGEVVVVSSSASDVQECRIAWVGLDGTFHATAVVLDGTSTVDTGIVGMLHLLGVELAADAVGTVTIRDDAVMTGLVVYGTIAPTGRTLGFVRKDVECLGRPILELDQSDQDRYVALVGEDEDGVLVAAGAKLASTDAHEVDKDMRRIYGVAVGHLPDSFHVKVTGRAWRYRSLFELVRGLGTSARWVAELGADVSLDGTMGSNALLDAVLDEVDLSGRWSRLLETTIEDIDGSTVHIPLTTESFTSAAVMRRRA